MAGAVAHALGMSGLQMKGDAGYRWRRDPPPRGPLAQGAFVDPLTIRLLNGPRGRHAAVTSQQDREQFMRNALQVQVLGRRALRY